MGFFSLIAKLGLDDSSFQTGADRVENRSKKMGASVGSSFALASLPVAALGAAFASGAYALNNWINSGSKAADAINSLAEQSGIAAENIQRLQILANQSGTSFEAYQNLLLAIGEARDKAKAGDAESIILFDRLHISDKILRSNQSNLEIAQKLSDVYKDQKNSVTAQADAVALIGKKNLGALSTISGYSGTANNPRLIGAETLKYAGINENEKSESQRRSEARAAEIAAIEGRERRGLRRLNDNSIEENKKLLQQIERNEIIKEMRKRVPAKVKADSASYPKESADEVIARIKREDEASKSQNAKFNDAYRDDESIKNRLKDARAQFNYSNKPNFDSGAASGGFYFGNDRTATLGGALKESADRITELTAELKISNEKLAKLYQD